MLSQPVAARRIRSLSNNRKVREADTRPKPEHQKSRGYSDHHDGGGWGMQKEDANTYEHEHAISLHASARYEHK